MAFSGYMTNGVVKKFSDGSLVITDGSETVTVLLEMGTLKIDPEKPHTWHKNRGTLDHRREGEEMPMKVSFSIKYYSFYASSGSITPYEALMGLGAAVDESWVSTTAAKSDKWSVHLELTYTDPIGTAGAYEKLALSDFAVLTPSFSEGEEANTLDFAGDCSNVLPTITAGSTS